MSEKYRKNVRKMSKNVRRSWKHHFRTFFGQCLPIWSIPSLGDPVQCSPVTTQGRRRCISVLFDFGFLTFVWSTVSREAPTVNSRPCQVCRSVFVKFLVKFDLEFDLKFEIFDGKNQVKCLERTFLPARKARTISGEFRGESRSKFRRKFRFKFRDFFRKLRSAEGRC